MSYNQIVEAVENGQVTDSVKSAYNYYMGSGAYDQFYGGQSGSSEAGMNSAYFTAMGNTISRALEQGKADTIAGALGRVWDQLSGGQQRQIQALLARYGMTYQS